MRELETEKALLELGDPDYVQGSTLDTDNDPDAPSLQLLVAFLKSEFPEIGDVYAPAIEAGGHEQHNIIGQLALHHFPGQVRPYYTYQRGSLRTRGREVVPRPGDVAAKLRALACYESQIELQSTRPWFMDDTLREYMP